MQCIIIFTLDNGQVMRKCNVYCMLVHVLAYSTIDFVDIFMADIAKDKTLKF